MRLNRSIFLGAALALCCGTVQAADTKNDVPGFNELDRNADGALSRTEAAGNPALAARFKEVDGDGDGKLSHVEYLKTMAKKDFNSLREKAAGLLDKDDKPASSGGTRK